MKEIRAIISMEKLDAVKEALKVIGVRGIMIPHIEDPGSITRLRLEIICKDEDVERVARSIAENACAGEIDDAKIFVYNCEDALQIGSTRKVQGLDVIEHVIFVCPELNTLRP